MLSMTRGFLDIRWRRCEENHEGGVDVPIWVGMFWMDSSSEYDVGLKQRVWRICVKFKKTPYSEVKFDCRKKEPKWRYRGMDWRVGG